MCSQKILVSNDDGIQAPGLQSLVHSLHLTGKYDLRVGAPDRERSGSSHSYSTIIETEVFEDGSSIGLPQSVKAFHCDGTPADSVRAVLYADIFEDGWIPDMVISGINRGLNAGKRLVVSGTVAAAREAVIRGIKAVAVSLHSFTNSMRDRGDYDSVVAYLLPVLDWILDEDRWPENVILNINIPCLHNSNSVPKGLVITKQGSSQITFSGNSRDSKNNSPSNPESRKKQIKFRFVLDIDTTSTLQEDDLFAVSENYMTICPVPILPGEYLGRAEAAMRDWADRYEHPLVKWTV